MNGIAPKMNTMVPSSAANRAQPCATAAQASSGICASTMHR
ncbi:Uncharacterised protein [Bordetella pertussis]|nr:Uncharacterised protein [Bordetella pertussis]CFP68438.1 Uncharacterised protein [Bordetella pertussis]CFW43676.1 Uncharacterised protein [Bordetella pertussis]